MSLSLHLDTQAITKAWLSDYFDHLYFNAHMNQVKGRDLSALPPVTELQAVGQNLFELGENESVVFASIFDLGLSQTVTIFRGAVDIIDKDKLIVTYPKTSLFNDYGFSIDKKLITYTDLPIRLPDLVYVNMYRHSINNLKDYFNNATVEYKSFVNKLTQYCTKGYIAGN